MTRSATPNARGLPAAVARRRRNGPFPTPAATPSTGLAAEGGCRPSLHAARLPAAGAGRRRSRPSLHLPAGSEIPIYGGCRAVRPRSRWRWPNTTATIHRPASPSRSTRSPGGSMRVKANLLQALARRDRRIVPVVGRVGVRPGITRSGPAGRFHVVGFRRREAGGAQGCRGGLSPAVGGAGRGRGEPGGCAAVHRRRSFEERGHSQDRRRD